MAQLPYPNDASLLTVNEVATLFRVTTKTVRRWIKNGTLPAARIGGHWRIARIDLRRFAGDRGDGMLRHAI